MATGFFGNWRKHPIPNPSHADQHTPEKRTTQTDRHVDQNADVEATDTEKSTSPPDTHGSPTVEALRLAVESSQRPYLLTSHPPIPGFLSQAYANAGVEPGTSETVALAARNRQLLAIRGSVSKMIRKEIKAASSLTAGNIQTKPSDLIDRIEERLYGNRDALPLGSHDALEQFSDVLAAAIETMLVPKIPSDTSQGSGSSASARERETKNNPTVMEIKTRSLSAIAHLLSLWPDLASRLSPFYARTSNINPSSSHLGDQTPTLPRSFITSSTLSNEVRLVFWQAVLLTIPPSPSETAKITSEWTEFARDGVDGLALALLSSSSSDAPTTTTTTATPSHLFSSHTVRSTIRRVFFHTCFHFISTRPHLSHLASSYAFLHLLESLVAFFYYRTNLLVYGDSRAARRRVLDRRFEAAQKDLERFAGALATAIVPLLLATRHLDPNPTPTRGIGIRSDSAAAARPIIPAPAPVPPHVTKAAEPDAVPPHRPAIHIPLSDSSSLARSVPVVAVANALFACLPTSFSVLAESTVRDPARAYAYAVGVGGGLGAPPGVNEHEQVVDRTHRAIQELRPDVSDALERETTGRDMPVRSVIERMMDGGAGAVNEADVNPDGSTASFTNSNSRTHTHAPSLPVSFLCDLPEPLLLWSFDQIIDAVAPQNNSSDRIKDPQWRLTAVLVALLASVIVERWSLVVESRVVENRDDLIAIFLPSTAGVRIAVSSTMSLSSLQFTYTHFLRHLVTVPPSSKAAQPVTFPKAWTVDPAEARRKSVLEREAKERRRRDAQRRWASEAQEDDDEERRWAMERPGVKKFRQVAYVVGKQASIIRWWKAHVKPSAPPPISRKPLQSDEDLSDASDVEVRPDGGSVRRRKKGEIPPTYPDFVTRLSALKPPRNGVGAASIDWDSETIRLPNSVPRTAVHTHNAAKPQRDLTFTPSGEQLLPADSFAETMWRLIAGVESVIGRPTHQGSDAVQDEWARCLDTQSSFAEAQRKAMHDVYGKTSNVAQLLNAIEAETSPNQNEAARTNLRAFIDSEQKKDTKKWKAFVAKVDEHRSSLVSRGHGVKRTGASRQDAFRDLFSTIADGLRESRLMHGNIRVICVTSLHE
ncbi:hypothetical protein M427DRAFT_40704 [Gonapodya prolifera JEL478]|uniref:Uncharacterized protein n=1 Tax=Gonapodya prolifera (strain JEL478) TaxID=1344416 RepID=A0A139AZ08_GONPJ|nr:hypothetical protein M427DRAFT_40704 [Gonapodya prolifera JEL478]|eukprot:KXS21940.1 hypothetical protein M427DRAFT_40704 [Gonapodya prolifera JEL478]